MICRLLRCKIIFKYAFRLCYHKSLHDYLSFSLCKITSANCFCRSELRQIYIRRSWTSTNIYVEVVTSIENIVGVIISTNTAVEVVTSTENIVEVTTSSSSTWCLFSWPVRELYTHGTYLLFCLLAFHSVRPLSLYSMLLLPNFFSSCSSQKKPKWQSLQRCSEISARRNNSYITFLLFLKQSNKRRSSFGGWNCMSNRETNWCCGCSRLYKRDNLFTKSMCDRLSCECCLLYYSLFIVWLHQDITDALTRAT